MPLTTLAASVLAIIAAVAWVHLGADVLVVVALPFLGVLLLVRRADATALVLPLSLLPYAINIAGIYVSASDILVMALGCCLLIGAAAGLEFERFRNPLVLPALAFVAWTLASAIWSAIPAKAFLDTVQRLEFLVFGVTLMATLPIDGRHTRRGLACLVAGAAMLGVATVVVGVVDHRYAGVYPIGIHKNAAGSFLSYGLIAAFGLWSAAGRRSGHRWLIVAILASLVGLMFTGSRGAWVGTLVAASTVVVMRRPPLIWPVASVTVIVVALFLMILPPDALGQEVGFGEKFSTASVRAETWQEGIQTIVAHPLLGVGAGNFVAQFNGTSFQVDPNNLLLLTWAETGLPGLAFLLWLLIQCLRLAWQNAHASSASSTPAAANQIGIAILVTAVVHAQFDMFWTRGTGLAAFLGAGLVVWANRAIIQEEARLPVSASTARPRYS